MRFTAFLFLTGFLAELASIILAGRWLGVIPVLILIVVSGLLGATVIRAAGMALADATRQATWIRGASTFEAISKLLQVVAGLLLILPGFASDFAAAVLLFPIVRRWLVPRIARNFTVTSPSPRQRPADGPIIEGSAIEIQADLESRSDRSHTAP